MLPAPFTVHSDDGRSRSLKGHQQVVVAWRLGMSQLRLAMFPIRDPRLTLLSWEGALEVVQQQDT